LSARIFSAARECGFSGTVVRLDCRPPAGLDRHTTAFTVPHPPWSAGRLLAVGKL